MKKSDKVIYTIILIMGIVTIFVISYFLLLGTMHLMNTEEYSKILIDNNIYSGFYTILNLINKVSLQMIIVVILAAIPYLIISIVLAIIFIKKYNQYQGKQMWQIIRECILGVIILFILIKGVSLYPLTNKYEIDVNKNISNVSNIEIKEFLQERIKQDEYVYKIEIERGFPDDYIAKIYYKDGIGTRIKDTFMGDSYSNFIDINAKDITNSFSIKSIILIFIGDILYIFFVVYILKEFKRISKLEDIKDETNIKECEYNK